MMLINYKEIGDTLTDSELNAYASLLANGKILTDEFKLKNGDINGEYGKYTFDLSNASIVDNGILITDETLSNDITVELENPTQYATYTLHLTVLRYGETSLLDEEPETTTIDLTLDLVKDTAVVIPMTDLQEYDVILFDSQITVKHDQPEIKGAYVTSLAITSDKLIVQNGQSATITVTALDLDTLPVANKSIKLYKDGTLLDTLTTDSNGQATKTITASSLAEISLVAKYQGTVTSEELVLNDTNLFDLTLTSNKDVMQTSETATLTATLTGDDTGLSGETITFEVYHNDTLQETLTGTTDSSGVATASYTGKGTGLLSIDAIIGDRIISSIRYAITDCEFYEKGTTGTPNTEWWKSCSSMQLTSDNTGLTASVSLSNTCYLSPNKIGTSKSSQADVIEWNDFVCEFTFHEITDTTKNITVDTRDANANANYRTLNGMNLNDGDIVKLVYKNNICRYYKNDVQQGSDYTNCSGDVQIRFAINNNSIRFSDFKVYPV